MFFIFFLSNENLVSKYLVENFQNNQQQISGRESTSTNDDKVAEDLMQNHESLLNTLQSRLTKLQVSFVTSCI